MAKPVGKQTVEAFSQGYMDPKGFLLRLIQFYKVNFTERILYKVKHSLF